MKLFNLISYTCVTFFFFISTSMSSEKVKFQKFVNNFAQTKLNNNFDNSLINEFVKNTKFIKRVVELDKSQPEFKLTLKQYLDKVVNKTRIKKAKIKLKENKTLLSKISQYYQVQPRFIIALWGIETDFGRIGGYFPVISSLATLVYDGRRASFFEKELIYALKIIKNGHISMSDMRGSWAGAMGQCQFMPSSFISYSQDWNKDGKKDIWNTKSDVFASTSNYLKKVNWDKNITWGRKVYFQNKDKLISVKGWYSLKKWKSMGIQTIDKKNLPNIKLNARLIIPDNYKNYGYLVYNNFESLLKWNRSNYFAIAVGTLSDHLITKKKYK